MCIRDSLNGGKHADNTVDLQEFMIMPVQADTFADGLRVCAEIYHNLKKICKERGLSTAVGDEGGFAPDLGSSSDVLRLIVESIEASGYAPGQDIKIAIDAAASELYDEKTKRYYFPGESRMSGSDVYRDSEAMVDYYEQLIREFPDVYKRQASVRPRVRRRRPQPYHSYLRAAGTGEEK